MFGSSLCLQLWMFSQGIVQQTHWLLYLSCIYQQVDKFMETIEISIWIENTITTIDRFSEWIRYAAFQQWNLSDAALFTLNIKYIEKCVSFISIKRCNELNIRLLCFCFSSCSGLCALPWCVHALPCHPMLCCWGFSLSWILFDHIFSFCSLNIINFLRNLDLWPASTHPRSRGCEKSRLAGKLGS